MKTIGCHLGVIVGMALTTWGILAWSEVHYGVSHLWPLSGSPRPHPVHLLALGLACLPPPFLVLLRHTPAQPDANDPANVQ